MLVTQSSAIRYINGARNLHGKTMRLVKKGPSTCLYNLKFKSMVTADKATELRVF